MALTDGQQEQFQRYTDELLANALAQDEGAQKELANWLSSPNVRRLAKFKAWAAEQRTADDTVVADQETRTKRMKGERDARKPTLDSIINLTRL